MAFLSRYSLSRHKNFSQKIAKAARNQPWSLTLLNLAWTAGPVTFLAIQGGYYAGFGKAPPIDAFIYFAGYTLIAGVLAVAVQLFRHAFYNPKIAAEERLMTDTVEQLFMMHFAVRNEYLQNYSEEDHDIIAAWWSIRSAATDIDVLEESIRNVTQSNELAHAIRRIEFYRRQGFADLMHKEYTRHAEAIHAVAEALALKFPQLAEHIVARFKGCVPSIRDGQPRPPGFLERLLAAGNQDNPSLATADDVLAMITFTLELLLGREVMALYPCFNGHKKLEDAKDEFDRLFSDYRLLRRKRNSVMRALISDLSIHSQTDMYHAMHASSEQLLPMLVDALLNRTEDAFGERRYTQIHQLNTQLQRAWKKLAEHERYYNRMWRKEGQKLGHLIGDSPFSKRRKSALSIEEHEIMLSPAQKNRVVKRICVILDDLVIRKNTLMGMMQTQSGLKHISMDDYKELAGNLLDILDEVLNISEPAEQLAIEESREADFGCVEPDLAAQTKLAWGRIMVSEVQEDRKRIAHRLAQSLVRFFNVPLGEATMEYLVDTYGASREFLEGLQIADKGYIHTATDALRHDLLIMPKWAELKPAYKQTGA